MGMTKAQRLTTVELFLRKNRFDAFIAALDEYDDRGEYYNEVFIARAMVASGARYEEIITWRVDDVSISPTFIGSTLKLYWVAKDFVPHLLKRCNENIMAGISLLVTEKVGRWNYNAFLKHVFTTLEIGTCFNASYRLRISALVRFHAVYGMDLNWLAAQSAMPAARINWMTQSRYKVKEKYYGFKEVEEEHPTINAPPHKLKGVNNMNLKLNYLTDNELCQLYSFLPSVENKKKFARKAFLVRLILGTGLRVSEAIGLMNKNVLIDEQPAIIIVENGKGKKTRAIQVIPEFEPYLRRHMAKRSGRSSFFFPSSQNVGMHIAKRIAQYWWKEMLEKAGLERVMPIHKGRHTFATWETVRLNPFQLQHKMGHSSINMTTRYYIHPIMGRDYSTDDPKWWRKAIGKYAGYLVEPVKLELEVPKPKAPQLNVLTLKNLVGGEFMRERNIRKGAHS